MDRETAERLMAHTVLHVESAVHGRVLLEPAAGTQAKGLLVGFHGYGEDAQAQFRRLAEIPGAASWTRVSVQALNRFYRGRSEEVVASWMTRQDRELSIADNLHYVDRVIAAALKECNVLTMSIVYAGFSQGAAMACRAGVRGRFGCAGVIAVGGDVPPELFEDSEARFPPLLLMRGTSDDWYTDAKFATDLAALRARNVDVRAIAFDGGHEWSETVAREVGAFLNGL
jgi:predicted esterase